MTNSDENSSHYQDNDYRREIIKLREQNKRSQTDSIHILVSIGIIGWYLTINRNSLLSFSNSFDLFFFSFTFLSILYLIIKINLVSVRDLSQNPKIRKMERSTSFLFFASLDGLVVVSSINTVLTRASITQFQNIFLLLSSAVAIIISIIPTIFYYQSFSRIDQSIQEVELIDLIIDNPDILEENFQPKKRDWINRDEGWLQRADIYGVDSDNNEVIVEVTPSASKNDVKRLSRSIASTDNKRYILAATEFSDSSLEYLQDSDQLEFSKLTINTWTIVPEFLKSLLA